jgi:ubiquinone/menaquinone biosynthesis C-methylase UbiE
MIPFDRLGLVFKVFSSLIYPRAFGRVFASSLERVRGKGTVLDAGSGTGILSRFACKVRGDLEFIMIDPSAGMLSFAPGFARRVMGKAEDLPFREGSFDAVFAGDCIHHFSDPRRAIMELRRVMREGGVLVVFEIDSGSALGAVIARGEKILGEPAHFYRPDELAESLTEAGLGCTISRYGWRYAITARAGHGRRVIG